MELEEEPFCLNCSCKDAISARRDSTSSIFPDFVCGDTGLFASTGGVIGVAAFAVGELVVDPLAIIVPKSAIKLSRDAKLTGISSNGETGLVAGPGDDTLTEFAGGAGVWGVGS